MTRIVIAGCGYVGTALGELLLEDGHEVFGLRRNPDALPPGIHPLARDLTSGEPPSLPDDIDYAVYCVGAKAGTEDAYRAAYVDGLAAFLRALSTASRPPKRVLFTSSTSVYGQTAGEWVDEESPAEPARFSGRVLLEAEALLGASGLPATVVRLGGIYGPGRTRLLERVARGEVAADSGAPLYTNRIHRDDAAGILRLLMRHGDTEPGLLLGVDSLPASQAEVVGFLAAELGVTLAAADRSSVPGAASFSPERAGSKRCSNARLFSLGYRLRYPTFREGYRPLVALHLARHADAAREPAR